MNCRLQVVAQIFVGYVVLHANKLYRNIKNRTVCFQERFRLLSLAAVLRKHPSWFQNTIDIVFWNRNVCFLRTGRSQNPENKSFNFLFIQGCAACNIPVVKIRQSKLRAAEPKNETPGGVPLYDWRITKHWEWLNLVDTSFIGTHPITVSSIT